MRGEHRVAAKPAYRRFGSECEFASTQDNERCDLEVRPSGLPHAGQVGKYPWDLRAHCTSDT
jgi:hypothetical protein